MVKVLDSSALINALYFDEAVTVVDVLNEIKDRDTIFTVRNQLMAGKIKLREPTEDSVSKVKEICRQLGDVLSKTDTKVLAVALDLKGEVCTDDYSIQNVASQLGLSFQPVGQKPIKKKIRWGKYCFNCKKYFKGKNCPVCGSKLGRKAKHISSKV